MADDDAVVEPEVPAKKAKKKGKKRAKKKAAAAGRARGRTGPCQIPQALHSRLYPHPTSDC